MMKIRHYISYTIKLKRSALVSQRSEGGNIPIPWVYENILRHWLNFMTLCDHSEFGTQNHSIGMEGNDSMEEEWKKYISRSLCCYSSLWYSLFLYVSYPTHLPVSKTLSALTFNLRFFFIILYPSHNVVSFRVFPLFRSVTLWGGGLCGERI